MLIRSIHQVLQPLGMKDAVLSLLADQGEDASLAENFLEPFLGGKNRITAFATNILVQN